MSAAEQTAPEVRIRPATEADTACIFSNWLKSYRKGSPWAERVPGPVYFTEHHAAIERLLKRSAVLVATHDDPTQILGWAAVEAIHAAGKAVPVLHYVYVKQIFRRMGIASALLAPFGWGHGFHSHHTPAFLPLARKLGVTFHPYLAGVMP